ncbi:MAG TPA: hypothetical protein VMW43_01685, partial [Bacteroidota bacterium]|nr:hypothetical protein [Bacteroidota bacterium]
MNTLIRIVLAVLLIPALAGIVRAQIPNAGFETWTNSTTPGSWVPNNTGFWTTVSRTTTSHTGTYAAQGQVTTYASSPIAPTLTSIVFPVSQRATALSGYYRFTQLGGDQIGAIVVMLKNSSAIGAGAGVDTVAYSSFTQVSIPIYYDDTTTVPDSAYIEIFIGPHTDSSKVHVGSSFIVDDLTFGGVSAVKELPGLPA